MSLHFTLTFEGMTGSSFEQCGDDALRIANQLGVLVVYSFNGIKCHVYPWGTTAHLSQCWEKARRSQEKHVWVSNV